MKILEFETVEKLPALYHPELDLLVISDLHLGLEGSMTYDGNYVPKHQLEDILKDLKKAKMETDASRLLVNGDLKNEFRTSRYAEKQEIEQFLEFADQKFEEIILIKGNHDTFIENTVEEKGIQLQDFHLEEGMIFTHGHRKIEALDVDGFEVLVIGHEHPALVLEDEIGVREKVTCFLHGETENSKKIIVMPPFSSISNGTDVNETPQTELLSPILRNRVEVGKLKAVTVSREAGLFEFPEIGNI